MDSYGPFIQQFCLVPILIAMLGTDFMLEGITGSTKQYCVLMFFFPCVSLAHSNSNSTLFAFAIAYQGLDPAAGRDGWVRFTR